MLIEKEVLKILNILYTSFRAQIPKIFTFKRKFNRKTNIKGDNINE